MENPLKNTPPPPSLASNLSDVHTVSIRKGMGVAKLSYIIMAHTLT